MSYKEILEVIKEILPEPLRKIVDKGLVLALAQLFILVFIAPLVIVFLAAFWLDVMSGSKSKTVASARLDYLRNL